MSKGTVIGSFYDSSFGNKVEIQYWDGIVSWYGHMSKRIAQEGETVMPGELVGLVGNTGHSFGSHLHLEIQPTTVSDSPVDPIPWLEKHGLPADAAARPSRRRRASRPQSFSSGA